MSIHVALGVALTAALAVESLNESLLRAAGSGDRERVVELLALGASVDGGDYRDGNSPLMRAAQGGHDEVVRALLSAGSDPTAVSDKEMTALSLASFGGRLAVVWTLLDAGADPNRRMEVSGTSPLALAVRGGHLAVVRALVKGGARLEGPTGTACLIIAVWRGDEEMTRELLALDAPVDSADRWGWTPLEAARETGNEVLADLLINAGARVPAEAGIRTAATFVRTVLGLAPWRARHGGHRR